MTALIVSICTLIFIILTMFFFLSKRRQRKEVFQGGRSTCSIPFMFGKEKCFSCARDLASRYCCGGQAYDPTSQLDRGIDVSKPMAKLGHVE